MASASERLAQLESVMKGINSSSKYKGLTGDDKAISFLKDKKIGNIETISSGSLVLDQILGGGLAKGRIIEIYGPEASGKTSIALTAVGNVQKEGGTAVFIDLEHALDPRYAKKLGVNLDELVVAQPESAETALDLVHDLAVSGAVDIIVVDSVAALVPQAELDGDASNSHVATTARLLSMNVKKLISKANITGTTVIFINQERTEIGKFSPFGTPVSTTGGKALRYYASQRIAVKRGQVVKGEDGDDKGKEIGNQVKFKIVKNKIAPPFGTGESVLTYNKGINVAAEMVEVGKSYGAYTITGRTYTEVETGEVFAKSKAEALKAMNTNPALLARLQVAVAKAIENDLFGAESEETEVDSENVESPSDIDTDETE